MVSIVLSPLLLSSFSVRNQANSFSKWGILHSEARQWVPFTGHSVSSNRDHGDCQQSACETGTVQDLKANQGTDTCSISGPALCVGLPKSPGLLTLLGGNAAGRAEACSTSSCQEAAKASSPTGSLLLERQRAPVCIAGRFRVGGVTPLGFSFRLEMLRM